MEKQVKKVRFVDNFQVEEVEIRVSAINNVVFLKHILPTGMNGKKFKDWQTRNKPLVNQIKNQFKEEIK